MKFPSFVKIPQHKRFQFQPRYYDPIREEIQERTERIRFELKNESRSGYASSNISSAFRRHRKSAPMSKGLIQFLIVIMLLASFYGYVFFIDWLLYIPLILIPIYLYLRLRRGNK